MSSLLTVEGITKYFNNRPVLEEVCFSVYRGEVLGLIGPNGSGKTTLFECLAGLLPANSGTIKSNKRELAPFRRNDALFYLPDSIFPWAEQRVQWVLILREISERLYVVDKFLVTRPINCPRLLGESACRLAAQPVSR